MYLDFALWNTLHTLHRTSQDFQHIISISGWAPKQTLYCVDTMKWTTTNTHLILGSPHRTWENPRQRFACDITAMSCPNLHRKSAADQRIKPSSPKVQIVESNCEIILPYLDIELNLPTSLLLFFLVPGPSFQLTLTFMLTFPEYGPMQWDFRYQGQTSSSIFFNLSLMFLFLATGHSSTAHPLLCTCLHAPPGRNQAIELLRLQLQQPGDPS